MPEMLLRFTLVLGLKYDLHPAKRVVRFLIMRMSWTTMSKLSPNQFVRPTITLGAGVTKMRSIQRLNGVGSLTRVFKFVSNVLYCNIGAANAVIIVIIGRHVDIHQAFALGRVW